MQTLGKDFAKYLIGPDKEKYLGDLEKINSIEAGLPPLERKVEFLATGNYEMEFSKNENINSVLDHYQKLIQIYPDEPRMQTIYRLASYIIDEQENKKKAFKALSGIRDIRIALMKDAIHIIYSHADKVQKMLK